MNCRPGDLAMVVKAYIPENVGLIVRVLPEGCMGPWGHQWLTESFRPTPALYSGTMVVGEDRQAWSPDAWLRPIRDPGDDARDQTLDWLPVPKMTDIEELGVAAEHLKALDRFIRERLT